MAAEPAKMKATTGAAPEDKGKGKGKEKGKAKGKAKGHDK
jgi:hypothetical protein